MFVGFYSQFHFSFLVVIVSFSCINASSNINAVRRMITLFSIRSLIGYDVILFHNILTNTSGLHLFFVLFFWIIYFASQLSVCEPDTSIKNGPNYLLDNIKLIFKNFISSNPQLKK